MGKFGYSEFFFLNSLTYFANSVLDDLALRKFLIKWIDEEKPNKVLQKSQFFFSFYGKRLFDLVMSSFSQIA